MVVSCTCGNEHECQGGGDRGADSAARLIYYGLRTEPPRVVSIKGKPGDLGIGSLLRSDSHLTTISTYIGAAGDVRISVVRRGHIVETFELRPE